MSPRTVFFIFATFLIAAYSVQAFVLPGMDPIYSILWGISQKPGEERNVTAMPANATATNATAVPANATANATGPDVTVPPPQDCSTERDIAARYKCEIENGLIQYCAQNFQSNYQQCFDHFAGRDHMLDKRDIKRVLEDLNIGGAVTRDIIADRIIRQFDSNNDGLISFQELKEAVKGFG